MHKNNLIPKGLPDKHVIGTRQYYQFDSKTSEGRRMCNSSSHAMLLWNQNPHALGNDYNADDDYLMRMKQWGDTTNTDAQIRCLREHFKLDVEFRQDLWLKDVIPFLMKGIVVPVGQVHHGYYKNPTGGGHWSVLVGWDFTKDRQDLIFHDPAGRMDLINGGYINSSANAGRYVRYRRDLWLPRWQVNGTLGWATLCHGKL